MSALNDSTKPAGEVISETMKAEGGPAKGSTAAQMQSEVAKSQQGNTASNTTKSPEAQTISEVAKEEGGTTKGSKSAQMQSELTKQPNAEQGVYDNNSTGNTNGTATRNTNGTATGNTNGATNGNINGIGKSAAGQVISEVAKAEGGTTKGSTSAKMQSELTKAQNAGQTPNIGTGGADPATRSHMAREANFEDAKAKVVPKMEMDPDHVTREDADLLRSRETRAHGVTEKGGVAATAQHLAAENAKKGTI